MEPNVNNVVNGACQNGGGHGPSGGGAGDATPDGTLRNPFTSLKSINPNSWACLTPLYTSGGADRPLTRIITQRVGHSLIPSQGSRKAYMIGGGNLDDDLNEIWIIDYSSGELKVSLSPASDLSGRYEFLSAIDEDKIWIFGGSNRTSPLNDIQLFDIGQDTIIEKFPLDTTAELGGDVPLQRTQGNNRALVEINGKKYLVVFGGGLRGEHSIRDGNIYLWDTEGSTWSRADVTGDTPSPRQGHSVETFGSKVFIYGGMEDLEFFGDVYMIDLQALAPAWTKIRVQGERKPANRAAHGGFAFERDMFVIGGLGDAGALSDLWKFNIDSCEWTEITPTNPNVFPERFDFAANLISTWEDSDPTKVYKYIIIQGGMNEDGRIFGDFWLFFLG